MSFAILDLKAIALPSPYYEEGLNDRISFVIGLCTVLRIQQGEHHDYESQIKNRFFREYYDYDGGWARL
ncbi:MAG: hypothetical protein ACJAT2_003610 [Bacteriovoracaceae bacterium]|jgi:hypothetical protein